LEREHLVVREVKGDKVKAAQLPGIHLSPAVQGVLMRNIAPFPPQSIPTAEYASVGFGFPIARGACMPTRDDANRHW
jgi:hypothetical protein